MLSGAWLGVGPHCLQGAELWTGPYCSGLGLIGSGTKPGKIRGVGPGLFDIRWGATRGGTHWLSALAPACLVQGGLDYLVLNHLGATPAGTRPRSVQATRWLLQASPTAARPRPSRAGVCPRCGDSESPPPPGELPELRAADFVGAAQPDGQQRLSGGRVLAARCGPVVRGVGRPQVSRRASLERAGRLPGGGGAQGCSPALLGPVPTSFSSPYSAAKFALDGFFGSLRRELDVQDVNVAITMCVLGLRDRASTAEGFRGVSRAKAAPGPKAALAVIRGGATRAPGVFYPWRFHLLCLLRGWLPHPRAWFIRQELNVSAAAAA
ncbi:hydroxysteroid 11-beta-dehydrogenase 1-like protein isoform X6 [Enhydra lutris kenyoni]|uniref:Hydroxysteroid 11-beta-dehydrogenase 1-like protein isoform X6 n=1 Tax=Enhydra lutris kenyoni TaxID=391180 RepID=A0A2Y9L525_ENHLU|nr:hydroxysteroid 11-beta-dehydrogenase 1-like protein isoform X6 [Enhydra lutris kenyoni]